jgi:hypothetical protein
VLQPHTLPFSGVFFCRRHLSRSSDITSCSIA